MHLISEYKNQGNIDENSSNQLNKDKRSEYDKKY